MQQNSMVSKKQQKRNIKTCLTVSNIVNENMFFSKLFNKFLFSLQSYSLKIQYQLTAVVFLMSYIDVSRKNSCFQQLCKKCTI